MTGEDGSLEKKFNDSLVCSIYGAGGDESDFAFPAFIFAAGFGDHK